MTSDEGAAVIDAPGAPSVPDILVRVEHVAKAFGPTQALTLLNSPVASAQASALARRTRDCRIAILGNAFCLREHPLTLAEEHAAQHQAFAMAS